MQRMSLKNQEYVQKSESGDGYITERSCVISPLFASMTSGGYIICTDFGSAICYALMWISEDLESLASKPQLTPSNEAFRTDLIVAEQALDDLLGKFLEQGYHTGMKERLKEIVNNAEGSLEIDGIWVFPEDLNDLIGNESINPFFYKYEDEYETKEEVWANIPTFDLSNPDHCEALYYRLNDLSC